jgi:hypothetical protein
MSENKNAKTPADDGQPVAWMHNFIEGNVITHIPADIGRHPDRWTPLYTTPPKREWVGLTDEEIDALSQARSLTDELMDCVDRLGSEADTVDPRVWQHLLVYAPKPEEEPVAWMHTTGTGHVYFRKKPQDKVFNPQPVFTAPPKCKWVGLTAYEIQEIHSGNQHWGSFACAIEAKLKEKNGG